MLKEKLLKCDKCEFTTPADYTDKYGKVKDGYTELWLHFKYEHWPSYKNIRKSLPKYPNNEFIEPEPEPTLHQDMVIDLGPEAEEELDFYITEDYLVIDF